MLPADALRDLHKRIESLNPQQREAVQSLSGPVLVLAGAGSGKTTVLTLRIANLIANGAKPSEIMATTFTNKAAQEMKERLEKLLRIKLGEMALGTFHSLCARILREHAELIGYTPDFTILDEEESRELIKIISTELGISNSYSPSYLTSQISRIKSFLKPDYQVEGFIWDLRKLYDERLLRMNAMDFDDLLLNFLKLLKEYPSVRDKLERRFKYIHVDEFQDLNAPQYEILLELRKNNKEIFVVGDDDQSIYGFRNAQVRFIRQFPDDFPGSKVIKLERNYRSTQEILDLANVIISLSSSRYGKKLWTDRRGPKPFLFKASSDREESRYLARRIAELHDRGYSWGDIAILYRVNHLSRILEEGLISKGIPYKVLGGLSFYSRKEIKDILAYLRLILNPNDDVSFSRVVNTPPRGIGKSLLATLNEIARERETSLFLASLQGDEIALRVSSRAKKGLEGLKEFADVIYEAKTKLESTPISDLTSWLIDRIGYIEYLESRGDNYQERIDNVYELISAMREFQDNLGDAVESNLQVLRAFLEWSALVSSSDLDETSEDKVKLMTIHAAKGLEFPVTFLVGLEDDILPHWRSASYEELEEERRLMYVAVTRAKDLLFLTYSQKRMERGRLRDKKPSRFLEDIPPDKLQEDSFWGELSQEIRALKEESRVPQEDLKEDLKERAEKLKKRSYSGALFSGSESFELEGGKSSSKRKAGKLSLFSSSNNWKRKAETTSKRKARKKLELRVGAIVKHKDHGSGVILALSSNKAIVSFSGNILSIPTDELALKT